jgi:MFS family permease
VSAAEAAARPAAPGGPSVGTDAGRILVLLFAANVLNFFDRAMPGILAEQVRESFPLSDTQIGIVAAAFTVTFAIAGVPLGRLADRGARRVVIGAGLTAWSAMTAVTGAVSSFGALLLARVGVGIGEAAYGPAAHSLIADLYPPARRSRAVAVFMLGLPLGLVLSFFTVGAIAEALDSWRAPFFIAALPGFVLAALLLRIREPERGASEEGPAAVGDVDRPLRRVAAMRPLWWLTLAFIGHSFASYTVGAFTVPLLQRAFGLGLAEAGALTGAVVGLTGLAGLLIGGRIAERAARRSPARRLLVGAAGVGLAVPLTFAGLAMGTDATLPYALAFGTGWLLAHLFFPTFFPAISDVVEPRLRATAIAMIFCVGSLLGGAGGPIAVGLLSDELATDAMLEAGATELTTALRGAGLHDAMGVLVPGSLTVAAVALLLAARSVRRPGAD